MRGVGERILTGLDFLRCCCHCGMKAQTKDIFCKSCSHELMTLRLTPQEIFARRGDFKVYSLWEWSEESLLQSLVLALKVRRDPLSLWLGLAEEFLLRRVILGSVKHFKAVLIPPPRAGWERDHAGHFGHALAALLGVPCLELLENPPGSRHQKFLNREERKGKVYSPKEPLHLRPVVWADDVVTTGFTARAGAKALDLIPLDMELWCLVRRHTLAY